MVYPTLICPTGRILRLLSSALCWWLSSPHGKPALYRDGPMRQHHQHIQFFCAPVFSWLVTPTERPTVPKAEQDRTIASMTVTASEALGADHHGRAQRPHHTQHNDGQSAVNRLGLNVVARMTQSSRPCATLRMVRMTTAMVVTLTPPPVEPGAAPMNCRMLIQSLVTGPQASRSMVFMPAVRVETD